MADARLDITIKFHSVIATQYKYSFSIPIADNVTSLILSRSDIIKYAKENNPDVDEAALITALNTNTFYKISPVNFNVPIDEEDTDILDHRLTTIDYNNMTSMSNSGSVDGLFSAIKRSSYYGAEIVKNLNIKGSHTISGGAPNLKEFYGDINAYNCSVTLFTCTADPETPSMIQKAVGDLVLTNITSLSLCTGLSTVHRGVAGWFNVLDIRNVDSMYVNCW